MGDRRPTTKDQRLPRAKSKAQGAEVSFFVQSGKGLSAEGVAQRAGTFSSWLLALCSLFPCEPKQRQTYSSTKRLSQVKGSEALAMSDRNTSKSPQIPYRMKNGNEVRLRLRTSFTTCDPVLRKWPAELGDALMRSMAISTSARKRKASCCETSRYCASNPLMSFGKSG